MTNATETSVAIAIKELMHLEEERVESELQAEQEARAAEEERLWLQRQKEEELRRKREAKKRAERELNSRLEEREARICSLREALVATRAERDLLSEQLEQNEPPVSHAQSNSLKSGGIGAGLGLALALVAHVAFWGGADAQPIHGTPPAEPPPPVGGCAVAPGPAPRDLSKEDPAEAVAQPSPPSPPTSPPTQVTSRSALSPPKTKRPGRKGPRAKNRTRTPKTKNIKDARLGWTEELRGCGDDPMCANERKQAKK